MWTETKDEDLVDRNCERGQSRLMCKERTKLKARGHYGQMCRKREDLVDNGVESGCRERTVWTETKLEDLVGRNVGRGQ